jgi:uncharacterized membrane protein YphA (DoxX/SURF4 family)
MFATLKATQSEQHVFVHHRLDWVIVRFLVAVVLLIAAFMKAHELATSLSFNKGLFYARWFNIAVVEFELFFGIWLLTGLMARFTWIAAITCFSMFTIVSASRFFAGFESCGCFGTVVIPPAWTATFDLIVVGLLLAFRPKKIVFHWQTFFKSLLV